ncbi:hypothetical protein D3C87_1674450 [compost metagenome]
MRAKLLEAAHQKGEAQATASQGLAHPDGAKRCDLGSEARPAQGPGAARQMELREALRHTIEEHPHDVANVRAAAQQEVGVPRPAAGEALLEEGDERCFLAGSVGTNRNVRLGTQHRFDRR